MNIVTPCTNEKKALVFFSSPNEASYTKAALDILLKELPENITTEFIDVFKTDISPCTDCKGCMKGECPFNGDGMGEMLNKLDSADIIICATPIYFNSVPAKFKAIFDRMQQLFVAKYFLKKPRYTDGKVGILISTAGSSDEFATTSINAMFNLFFKSINAEFISHFAINKTDNFKPNEIALDNELLQATITQLTK